MLAPRFAAGFAGGLPAFGRRRRKRQRQGALDQRGRRHRSRPVDLGRARIRYPRRLAHLLAQSRGFGPGHDAALDAARRGNRRGHRLDRAASLRNSAAGQLRLCQARDAPGADHGGAATSRPGHRSSLPPRRVGWCAPTCASPRVRNCTCACRSMPRGGAVDPAVAPLFAAARAELPSAAAGGDRRQDRRRSLVLTLGTDWGATLSQIKRSGVLPL